MALSDFYGKFLVPIKLGKNCVILGKNMTILGENSAFFLQNWESLPFKLGFFC